MKRRDYYAFIADIYRFRPLAVIVASILVIIPSVVEMVTQGLSAIEVLLRLCISIIVMGILVWLLTGLVLRYAKLQEKVERDADSSGRMYL